MSNLLFDLLVFFGSMHIFSPGFPQVLASMRRLRVREMSDVQVVGLFVGFFGEMI